ncbi:Hypothetical protein MYEA_6400 [Mycoplasma yeatsii 13926]|uniref:Uncharacterized protein n=1 Tax=Mycoplasma yeatsii 13926 TaxID=1188240 RepID=S6G3D3_9MOLU|nr:hypothetical protein [Mycoplasma yeatsii]EOA07001.1 Hypothetical protein MYEA_6400 [Mycoplasma yeatsii 13926]
MKKIILPVIGSLVIGSILSGGTIYAIQKINNNKEIQKWRILLEKKERECEMLKRQLEEELEKSEKHNRDIAESIAALNEKIVANFNEAKEVYKKAVALTTYTVKDTEEKNVNYYLAYFDSGSKEIKTSNQPKTTLTGNEKQIPATLEGMLITGIDKLLKEEAEFKKDQTLDRLDNVQKVIKEILEKAKQGGQKLTEFFQKQIDELKKLKLEIQTIHEKDFVELLKSIDPSITPENWKDDDAKNTLDRLNKIKTLLKNLKSEWDFLSDSIKEDILPRLDRINKDSKENLDRLKNGTDPLAPASRDQGGRGEADDSSGQPENMVS